MAQENIDFGSFPNDPNADAIRVAFQKAQNNFSELYAAAVENNGVQSIIAGAGLTQDLQRGNVTLKNKIAAVTIQTGSSLLVGTGSGATGNSATITTGNTAFTINVSNTVTTANIIATNGITGTLKTNAQPNVTSLGTLTGLTSSGTVVSPLFRGNLIATTVQGNYVAPGSNTQVMFNNSGTIGGSASMTYDGTRLTVLGNITASMSMNAGNSITANYHVGTISTAAQPLITSVGTLTSLTTSGNLISANANLGNLARANYFSGNANPLFGINGANVITRVPTANHSYYSDLATLANVATIAGTVTTNAQPNINSVGTLTGLTVSGTVVAGPITSHGNVIVDGTASAYNLSVQNGTTTLTLNANTITSNLLTSTKIVTSNINGSGVYGNVPSANVAYYSNVAPAGPGIFYPTMSQVESGNSFNYTHSNFYYNPSQNTLRSSIISTRSLQVDGGVSLGSNIVQTGTLTSGDAGTQGYITGKWTLTTGSTLQSTYADLAEYYSADDNIEPGTVVEFGGVEEITTCNTDMSRRVAGVVTTEPAYILNSHMDCLFPVAVALQGKAPVKIIGKVRKGDMMVSAGHGRAKACVDPAVGSVIGKSLENFDGQEGIINVAIGRL